MGMHKVLSLLILLAISINILVFIVITLFILKPDLSGLITVGGGNYTRVDFEIYDTPQSWGFIYGNISQSGSDNVTVAGGVIHSAVIEGDPSINNTWVFASSSPELNVSELEAVDPSALDSQMGLRPASPLSGTNVFNLTLPFQLGNRTVLAWTIQTRSSQGDYIVGLFNGSYGLVYVTKMVASGVGFNNESSHFQILLPVSGNTTYHLSTWSNETENMNCSHRLDLQAEIIGNDTVLRWDPMEGAQSYTVSYIENITDPDNVSEYRLNYSSATTVPGIMNTTWTDNTSQYAKERYYTVTSVSGSQECEAGESVASLRVGLLKTGQTGYNFISTPLELMNESTGEVFDPILDDLVRAYWYNNTIDMYYDFSRFCFGNSCITIDNIGRFRPHQTYWIQVDDNVTLPLAGKVQNSTELSLSAGYNANSFHIIEGDRKATSVFDQIYGNMTTVYEYDNGLKYYRQFTLFCVGNSCMPIGDLESVEPVVSYWIGVTGEEELIWPR